MNKYQSRIKTAIMTFHMANNHGAMLQAYALQKVISNMGLDCEILDYRLQEIYNRNGIFTLRELILCSGLLKGTVRFFWRYLFGRYRSLSEADRKFDHFMRHDLKLSERVYFHKEKLNKAQYDAIIFGSDQIWNPERTGGYAPEYLGTYFDKGKTSFVAYAASCGSGVLPAAYQNEYIEHLRNFTAISVREKSLAQYLNHYCNIPTEAVLDPVLLSSTSLWEALDDQGSITMDEPYCLIYSFDAGKDIYKIALQVAKERDLKPVAICYQRQSLPEGIDQILNCGPKDFIHLVKHATFICTTSFHGLAFSILFEKNFYCMAHPEVGQRERDLIELLGLKDRLFERADDLKEVTNCDYTEVRTRLEGYRKKSLSFLKRALEKIEHNKTKA